MEAVRTLLRDDIDEVASLWAKVFRRRNADPDASTSSSSDAALAQYIETIFLLNPWRVSELSSLVYRENNGRITGFLGVLPRRMRFLGKPIPVAIASQLMVDPDKPRPFASIELLRKFFTGPQELSFTDGATRLAQELWEAAGGSMARLYCSSWTRVLRPARYALFLCEKRKLMSPVARAFRPICWALDAAAMRIPDSPFALTEQMQSEAEECADATVLLNCVREFSAPRALQPEYDLPSFQWLLEQARQQRKHGELHAEIVRRCSGEIVGWYAYYVKPGGVGQVLQIAGRPRHMQRVVDHLFRRAYDQGAVAVSGQLDPAFSGVLAGRYCSFNWSNGVLIQSGNEGILSAIHRGDAFLTRFEGEWWMRFCDLRRRAPAETRPVLARGKAA